MRALLDGILLDQVSTSMTINAPAALLLLLYQLVGEDQGVDPLLDGTIQNDVLKEYIARGTYIFPPKPSLRLDRRRPLLPGGDPALEHDLHLRLSHGRSGRDAGAGDRLTRRWHRVRAGGGIGQDVDDFAPRLAFFFVARTTLLEEVAKLRAARRIWAQAMRDEFGARNPKSQMLRFQTQTAGVQLTAQQPEVNLVRVALQGLGAVLGGTQSLHTNAYDEAIALPTEKAARLALRTQQVWLRGRSTATVDPFAGSYAVESMTDDIEAATSRPDGRSRIRRAVAAIERGFQKTEIERSAYRIAQEIDAEKLVVVGLNRFAIEAEEPYEPLRVDPAIEEQQSRRLATLRKERSAGDVDRALTDLRKAAEATTTCSIPCTTRARPVPRSARSADALRQVWAYVPPDAA